MPPARAVRWLCVAEKPSISRSITNILSGGQFTTRNARAPAWIKNYDFTHHLPSNSLAARCLGGSHGEVDFTVTAVAGHLTSSDFTATHKGWKSCDPFELFDAEIIRFTNPDPAQKGIEANLKAEAKKSTHLMIWTDCDREGEHIGSEVAEVCQKANPRIVVKRARFSAIIASQINNAARNPVDLDMRQADAVSARMDLDLRIGAALTRTQTLELQTLFEGALAEKLISYGPCQFPTLGFVVDQYEKIKAFVPENFWYIEVKHTPADNDGVRHAEVLFTWSRGRLYDEAVVKALFALCKANPIAKVTSVRAKPTQKWKPLPLTTVELQKTGSRLLHMTPKKILDTSDSLYQRGFLSYPRTETDQFDKEFDFMELIAKHTSDGSWGAYAQGLIDGAFDRPKNGSKNDKAHPPIHPTSHVSNLTGEEKAVYDLVTRRFLACCSKNAKGLETTVEIEIAQERFSAHGLVVQEKNYLEVYIYDKWLGHLLPDFHLHQEFLPQKCDVRMGTTVQPSLLTEADLVSLMDKNGIGTDATIAEHISKIIEREYVFKQREGRIEYLVPSTLGIGLVEGYNAIGLESSLSKPHLRRLTEHRMNQICDGTKTKREVIEASLEEYREMSIKVRREFPKLVNAVGRYIVGGGESDTAIFNHDTGVDSGRDPEGDEDNSQNQHHGRGGGGGGGHGGSGGGRDNRNGGVSGSRTDTDRSNGRATQPGVGGPVHVDRASVFQQRNEDGSACDSNPLEDLDDEKRPIIQRGQAHLNGYSSVQQVHHPRRTPEDAVLLTKVSKVWDEKVQDQHVIRYPQPSINCDCGLPAIEKTVNKEGPNKGKFFFVCSKGPDESCKYFAWAGEKDGQIVPSQSSENSRSKPIEYDTDRECDCGLHPVVRTTFKEGPNKDRQFLKCPKPQNEQCSFFQWRDEANIGLSKSGVKPTGERYSTVASPSRHGAASNPTGDCFNCGKPGHWSRDCPKSKKPTASKSQVSGSDYTCYKCGIAGHYASNCPADGASYKKRRM